MTEPTSTAVQTKIVTAPTESVVTKIESDFAYLKHHAILLAVVGTLILGGVYGVENLIAKHDTAKDAQYQSLLAAANARSDTIEKQLSSDEQNWQKVQAALLAQNANLVALITARDKTTQDQVKKDATLDAAGAADRISGQTQATPGEVVAQGNNVVLDLPVSRRVAADLDLLPSVQADLADTQKQLSNETTLFNNSQKDVAEQKTLVTAQQNQLVTEQKACKAEVAAIKAKHRKTIVKVALACLSIGFGIGVHYF